MGRGNTIRIADGHSDLLQELVFAEQQGEDNPFRTRWLEQLQDGGVVLQVCAVYEAPQVDAGTAFRHVLREAIKPPTPEPAVVPALASVVDRPGQ